MERRNYILTADDSRMNFSFYADDGNYIKVVVMPDDVEVTTLTFDPKEKRTLETLSVDGRGVLEHMETVLDSITKAASEKDGFLMQILRELKARCHAVEGG